MNRDELMLLWTELSRKASDIQSDIHNCCHRSLKMIDELGVNDRGPVFNHEHGSVVYWDGDFWFLNSLGDTIFPLGHARGDRIITRDANPEEGYITPECLVDVGDLLDRLQRG